MTHKDYSCEQDIFVVSHLHHNLSLHLLTRVEPINTMTSTIQQEFPNLFTGLGTLQGDPYTICIKPLSLWEQPEIFRYLFETKFKRHSTKWKHKVSSQKYNSPLRGARGWFNQEV